MLQASLFFQVNEWKIIDTMTIHDFQDQPLNIVNVVIGTCVIKENDSIKEKPITRWMTEHQFYYHYIKR